MRRVISGCAVSLDCYIAGPNGEFDWIVMDPEIDFAAMLARFDTFLIGRKTFEVMQQQGGDGRAAPGAQNIVFSRTLKASDFPQVTISPDAAALVAALREQSGKDIALFGGGELFRSLLAEGLVDAVELAVVPVLLGGGVPLLPSPAPQAKLRLREHRVYKTGIVSLEYDVVHAAR